MTFDATDKKYQINDEFPPNKESEWKHSIDKDGWTHSHNSLRLEMRSLVEAVEGTKSRGSSIQEWEAKCIKTAWAAHLVHVHAHHSNEDAIMVPFLETRLVYPKKMETDHKELEAMLEKLGKMADDLKTESSVELIHEQLIAYETMMKPHLKEEEVECLPLMRAYFTPKEIAPKIQEIIGEGPPIEMGSFIKGMGVKKFRKEFMPQEHIPWFVWYIAFKSRVKSFEKAFEKPINALKSGEKPKQKDLLSL